MDHTMRIVGKPWTECTEEDFHTVGRQMLAELTEKAKTEPPEPDAEEYSDRWEMFILHLELAYSGLDTYQDQPARS